MEEAPRIERGERRSKEQDGMGTTVFAWNEVEARYALGRLQQPLMSFKGRERTVDVRMCSQLMEAVCLG